MIGRYVFVVHPQRGTMWDANPYSMNTTSGTIQEIKFAYSNTTLLHIYRAVTADN